MCACFDQGQCVFYCMSTSPNAGQIKPFLFIFLLSALLLVASCLILEDYKSWTVHLLTLILILRGCMPSTELTMCVTVQKWTSSSV